ncbi:MAG: lactate utilization protein [Planctomycetota bacterium]|nr:lactate utilization protein [Planctomycetota bacterium]
MNARDTILARIREALRVPAPLPHLKSRNAQAAAVPAAAGGHAGLTVLPLDVATPWLPDGGDSPAEQLQLLTENLEKLRATVVQVADAQAAAEYVARLAHDRGWGRVAYHDHSLVGPLAAALPCETYRVDAPACDKRALESCDAGITTCEALISQTGSLLVSSATGGGRGLSILPHVHVVVATLDQIVPTLGDALHQAKERHAGRLPSMLSFITGPSRTGDIERILVLGAHGPKELFVILVG